jgi:hypothetical protein
MASLAQFYQAGWMVAWPCEEHVLVYQEDVRFQTAGARRGSISE